MAIEKIGGPRQKAQKKTRKMRLNSEGPIRDSHGGLLTKGPRVVGRLQLCYLTDDLRCMSVYRPVRLRPYICQSEHANIRMPRATVYVVALACKIYPPCLYHARMALTACVLCTRPVSAEPRVYCPKDVVSRLSLIA